MTNTGKLKTARLSLTMSDPPEATERNSPQEIQADLPIRGDSREKVYSRPRNDSTSSRGRSDRIGRRPDHARVGRAAATALYPPDPDLLNSPASPISPTLMSLPALPTSPGLAPKHARDQSKSFFANLKGQKGTSKDPPAESTIRKVPKENSTLPDDASTWSGKTKSTPDLRAAAFPEAGSGGTSPDLAESNSNSPSSRSRRDKPSSSSSIPGYGQRSTPADTSNGAVASPPTESQESRKNGRLFQTFMKRNNSNRGEDASSNSTSQKPPTPTAARAPPPESSSASYKSNRDRSGTRNASPHSEDDNRRIHDRSHHPGASRTQLRDQRSQPFREGGTGASLLSGIKNTAGRAAEGLGKAQNRFFRQVRQQPSAPTGLTGRPRPTEASQHYELKVINQRLAEQTRITRIKKSMEDCIDKTEFWMPALPWRCIDFLNLHGCDVEGLYRVPGSDREIRMWKQRFDQEYDIDLFKEDDLYDVNTIGSLFKAWLRELPEDVFPQKMQEELSASYGSQVGAPEELRTTLSNLPPFNYYLLFATTCHLSLLNESSEKNKMSFTNLFVCFAPALRLNGDCFRWLVADWKNCWKGCETEHLALRQEINFIEDERIPGQLKQDGDAVYNPPAASTSSIAGSIEVTHRGREASGVMERPVYARSTSSREASRGPVSSRRGTTNGETGSRSSRDGSRAPMLRRPTANAAAVVDGERQRQQAYNQASADLGNDNNDGAEVGPNGLQSPSQLPELSFPQPISPIFSAHP